jgi:hypothetical protein
MVLKYLLQPIHLLRTCSQFPIQHAFSTLLQYIFEEFPLLKESKISCTKRNAVNTCENDCRNAALVSFSQITLHDGRLARKDLSKVVV